MPGKGTSTGGEASLDEQTRTIDVIVRVPDPFSASAAAGGAGAAGGNPPLLVGEFVEVEIQGLAMDGCFELPRAALHAGDEVWAVNDGGGCEHRSGTGAAARRRQGVRDR